MSHRWRRTVIGCVMEGKKIRLALFCAILWFTCVDSCEEKQLESLHCTNDYNNIITCTWNSTNTSPGLVCKLHSACINHKSEHTSSCELKALDVSRSEVKKCSMVFEKPEIFRASSKLNITLSCGPMTQSLSMNYTPICHIKQNPPTEPSINMTTVSWFSRAKKYKYRLQENDACELQWKREDQPWHGSSLHQTNKMCNRDKRCTAELDEDELIRGERYEARVRARVPETFRSSWSDWSPTASWVSKIGNKGPSPPPPDAVVTHLWKIVFGAASVCTIALIVFWSNKNKWVYIKQKVPDPGKSFLKDVNYENWLSPYFTPEWFHSSFKPVQIVPVEIIGHVDCVTPLTLMEKFISEKFHESSSSSFSNPSYSQVCSSPLPSVTVGNLVPCPADSPYGKVQDETTDVVKELLSNNMHAGLLSKEVSHEKMETGGFKVASHQANDPNNKTLVDIQRFFDGGTGGGVFSTGSIQLCSGYKFVSCQQDDHEELPSLDSGVGSESDSNICHKDDVDIPNSKLQPPQASSPGFLPMVAGLSPAQKMQILEKMGAMSESLEPSCDGYKPIRQSQSD